MMAGLAAGALALNAPVASAGHEQVLCRFNAVSQATATGQDTWEGVAEGIVVGNPTEAVSIRCVVRVSGVIAAATVPGSGTGVATTADRVTYARTLTQVTQLCAQYTSSHGASETCFATTTTQVPPQEVIDALYPVDVAICSVLDDHNGFDNGVIRIQPGTADQNGNTGGDVYVNGALFWDCPGYEA